MNVSGGHVSKFKRRLTDDEKNQVFQNDVRGEKRKDGRNGMNADKSSKAVQTLTTSVSWENRVLHQPGTSTHMFWMGGIWEIRWKCERGEIFPSLIIIITVSSPFSAGQLGIESDILLPSIIYSFSPFSL